MDINFSFIVGEIDPLITVSWTVWHTVGCKCCFIFCRKPAKVKFPTPLRKLYSFVKRRKKKRKTKKQSGTGHESKE